MCLPHADQCRVQFDTLPSKIQQGFSGKSPSLKVICRIRLPECVQIYTGPRLRGKLWRFLSNEWNFKKGFYCGSILPPASFPYGCHRESCQFADKTGLKSQRPTWRITLIYGYTLLNFAYSSNSQPVHKTSCLPTQRLCARRLTTREDTIVAGLKR